MVIKEEKQMKNEGGREGRREGRLTGENGALHGRTVSDGFIGVDALVQLLAVEEVREELLDLEKEGGVEGGREGGRGCVK